MITSVYRLIFLFLLGLGPVLPLRAQPVHRIELGNQPLSLSRRAFYVQRVIDARPDTTTLGEVHLGVLNRPVAVALPGPLAPYLQEYLSRQLPARPTDRPVVLRVTALRVAETITYNSETSKAHCTLEWYEPLPTGRYRRLGAATGATRRGGLDVTGFHASNLVVALQQSLEQVTFPAVPDAQAPVVTAAQLVSTADLAPGGKLYPVLEAEVINKGRYRTFHDFRDNAPDRTLPFEVETKPNTEAGLAGTYSVRPYTPDATGKQRPLPADTWGFSDGKNVFIRYQNGYFPLERQGSHLSFRVYSVQPGPLVVGPGGLLGAAIGVAVASALTRAYVHEFSVDIVNGNVFDTTNLTQISGPVADSARVILFRFEGAKAGPPALVLLNGVPLDTLPANAQFTLRLHHQTGPWQLCLRAADSEACLNLEPSFRQPNYVDCAAEIGTKARLRVVPVKEGEFALRRIGTWQQVMTKRTGRTAAK